MDETTFRLRTAPYVVLVCLCDAGHLHVRGGFLSDVPVDEEYEDTSMVHLNKVTGEILRIDTEILFSLN